MAAIVKKAYINTIRNRLQKSRTNKLHDSLVFQRDSEYVLWFDLLDDEDPQSYVELEPSDSMKIAFDASVDASGSDLVSSTAINDLSDRTTADAVTGLMSARIQFSGNALEKYMEFKPSVTLKMTFWVQDDGDATPHPSAVFQVPVTIINSATESSL